MGYNNPLPWWRKYNPSGRGAGKPTEEVTQRIPIGSLCPDAIGMIYRKLAAGIHCLCCNLEVCCTNATQALADAAAAMARANEAYDLAALGGASSIQTIPKDPTRYYAMDGAPSASTASLVLTANRVYYEPLLIQKEITITEMSCNVTVGVASSSIKLGIYEDTGAGTPGEKIMEVPAISTVASGAKSGAPAATAGHTLILQPGFYWLALLDTHAVTATSFVVAGINTELGFSSGASGITYRYESSPGGTLPATAAGSNTTAANTPVILYRGTET